MAASIFDRYGIKEVADVTFYSLKKDEENKPVLYLDTLKVSTLEQNAENTAARGGKGNPELITWDYGKEITVTLEDALFSAKSMAMMFGNEAQEMDSSATVKRVFLSSQVMTSGNIKINGKEYAAPTSVSYYKGDGSSATSASFDYAVGDFSVANATKIVISSDTFPGTYKVVGDTYAKSEESGEDSFFQFVINKAKIQSEVTLTMEADGDPSTFSMNLKVLRPKNGEMIELIKYDLNTPNA